MPGKPFITDYAFDPTKLLDSNTLGVAPANTTLTVLFLENDSDSVNVAQGNLNTVSLTNMVFPNSDGTKPTLEAQIRSTMEVANDEAIVGNTALPSSEEIRYRTYAAKAAQMRAVTRNDYEGYIYMMPANFGAIKRASVINDPSSTNRRLSVYVVSEDENGNLVTSNPTIKQNVKSWLNKNKMLNDNIDIYDAKIVNIAFDYEVIVHPNKDKFEVLNLVNQTLAREMSSKMYIGEPFYMTNIYNIINKVDGVIDVTKVTPYLKDGTSYSTAAVTIQEMKSADGTYLKAPRNVIFEIKFFNTDIRGTAI